MRLGPLAQASFAAWAAFATFASCPREARAEGREPLPEWETARATRRSGFTAGLTLAATMGTAEGTQNDYAKLGDPAWLARTGGVGFADTFWLGGALTDWFTFGLGFGGRRFGGSQLKASSSEFLFHVEGFPLFARGGAFRDLAVFGDFGTGSGKIALKSDGAQVAGGGALSIVGLGVHWEAVRILGGHVALGPTLSWEYQTSDPLTMKVGMLGLRTAFYGGP